MFWDTVYIAYVTLSDDSVQRICERQCTYISLTMSSGKNKLLRWNSAQLELISYNTIGNVLMFK